MGDKLSDEQIIERVLRGDVEAYARIVERYEPKLLRYGRYLLKDYDAASDVVQETFIKAYVNLRSFNIKRKFSSWIYRILHNEAMNVIKRNKKTITLGDYEEFNDEHSINFEHDRKIDNQLLNSNVRKCLSDIDIKYREVLMLNYFEGLKYEEISDILHLPTSTVGVRIKRGKEILKKQCQDNGVSYD